MYFHTIICLLVRHLKKIYSDSDILNEDVGISQSSLRAEEQEFLMAYDKVVGYAISIAPGAMPCCCNCESDTRD